jgi:uncharacterized metal-binding protein
MPSGRTHDVITGLLAPVACASVYAVTREPAQAAIVGAAFLFGGLLFGPDLDTVSRQYSRWSLLRFLWFPYRAFFPHRSRFTHGLIFGPLIRVVYFLGITTLAAVITVAILAYITGAAPSIFSSTKSFWTELGRLSRIYLPPYFLLTVFVGTWLGAASHTLTDVAGSFIKTGRIAKLF